MIILDFCSNKKEAYSFEFNRPLGIGNSQWHEESCVDLQQSQIEMESIPVDVLCPLVGCLEQSLEVSGRHIQSAALDLFLQLVADVLSQVRQLPQLFHDVDHALAKLKLRFSIHLRSMKNFSRICLKKLE